VLLLPNILRAANTNRRRSLFHSLRWERSARRRTAHRINSIQSLSRSLLIEDNWRRINKKLAKRALYLIRKCKQLATWQAEETRDESRSPVYKCVTPLRDFIYTSCSACSHRSLFFSLLDRFISLLSHQRPRLLYLYSLPALRLTTQYFLPRHLICVLRPTNFFNLLKLTLAEFYLTTRLSFIQKSHVTQKQAHSHIKYLSRVNLISKPGHFFMERWKKLAFFIAGWSWRAQRRKLSRAASFN